MKKLIEVTLAAMLSMLALVPLVAPTTVTSSGMATASVTVSKNCDVTATSLDFGPLLPGSVSLDPGTGITPDSTVAQTAAGNTLATLDILGTDWSDGVHTFSVAQTHYATGGHISGFGGTALDVIPGSLGSLNPTTPLTVHFVVGVPNNQPAGSYGQTITFSVSC